jgi:hypothetical protein
MTIIKADPGFELLAAHHDGEFKIDRSPIVAWRIEGDFAEPIARNACSNASMTIRMPRMYFSVTTSLAMSPRSFMRYLRW